MTGLGIEQFEDETKLIVQQRALNILWKPIIQKLQGITQDTYMGLGTRCSEAATIEEIAARYDIPLEDSNYLNLGCGSLIGYDYSRHEPETPNILLPAVIGYLQRESNGMGKSIGVDLHPLESHLPGPQAVANWQLEQYTHLVNDLIPVMYEDRARKNFLEQLAHSLDLADIESTAASFGIIHASEFIVEGGQSGNTSQKLENYLIEYQENRPEGKYTLKTFLSETKELATYLLRENGIFIINNWVYQKQNGILVKVFPTAI